MVNQLTKKQLEKVIEFGQDPPQLGNQYLDDVALRLYLDFLVPNGVRKETKDELTQFGAHVVS